MSKALGDREYQKFKETSGGETAVRVIEESLPNKNFEGNELVANEAVESLLYGIMRELRKVNMHLANITDIEHLPGDEEI
jgi:hypothetical protein